MKNFKFKLAFLICIIVIVGVIVLKSAKADLQSVDTSEEPYADILVAINGPIDNEKAEIRADIDNLPSGKRVNDVLYCKVSDNCAEWKSLKAYDSQNRIDGYVNNVGNNDMSIDLIVPNEDIKIKIDYVDFEPMNISYAKYNLSTTDENRISEIYNDKAKDPTNYDVNNFVDIVTGYVGGDIILPKGCTDNGCLLKVTLASSDFDNYQARLDENNNREFAEIHELVDLASMFNHLQTIGTDTAMVYKNDNGDVVIDEDSVNNTKSIYIYINKYFNETNMTAFVFGDNKNRILSEDYVGVDYKLDNNRKYFDEKGNFGDLTFNEFNNYTASAELFYGVKHINFIVDKQKSIVLAAGGDASGMGQLKYPYTKIESKDNDKYPVDNNFRLTINSFYEPEYNVGLVLKNDSNEVVKEITISLNRFAFGGNAGSLLVVDGNGINCKRQEDHPNCTGDNMAVSTDYRGLVDTFYTDGTMLADQAVLAIARFGNQDTADIDSLYNLYARNKDFNPWATAIYYSGNTIVATRSFDLGEVIKFEGFNRNVIDQADLIDNFFKMGSNERVKASDFEGKSYSIFGYGNGFDIPMKDIEWFDERTYNEGIIEQQLILATRKEINDNNITKIALFLTNGELKSDEANFPELTYGVGEGKIFFVDDEMFREVEGN